MAGGEGASIRFSPPGHQEHVPLEVASGPLLYIKALLRVHFSPGEVWSDLHGEPELGFGS